MTYYFLTVIIIDYLYSMYSRNNIKLGTVSILKSNYYGMSADTKHRHHNSSIG